MELSTRTHHIHSDPRILPSWAEDNDAEFDNVVNGWNSSLEEWMDTIQKDSAQMYCMLLHFADHLFILKWVFLIVYAILAFVGVLMNAVVAIMELQDILWVQIITAVILALGPTVLIVIEAAGFSSKIQACRDIGGDFNILGLRIEAQKRQTRRHRQSGVRFSNAASIRFEELRKESPRVFRYIKKMYPMGGYQTTAAGFNIPSAVLGLCEDEDVLEGEEIPEEIVNDEFFADSQLQAQTLQAKEYSRERDVERAQKLSQVVIESEDDDDYSAGGMKGEIRSIGGYPPVYDVDVREDSATEHKKGTGKKGPLVSPRSSEVGIQNIFQSRLRMIEAERKRNLDVTAYEDYVRAQYFQGRKGAAVAVQSPRGVRASRGEPRLRQSRSTRETKNQRSRSDDDGGGENE